MTVQALSDLLHTHNLAFPNLGSISDTSIGGIISTGTHGSGLSYGILATHVLSLSLMLADGSTIFCSREENSDAFMATLCGLGTTGLITRVKWQVEPAFRLKEIREVRRIDEVIENLDEWSRKGEYVRLWWSPQTDLVSVMVADRTDEVCPLLGFCLLSIAHSAYRPRSQPTPPQAPSSPPSSTSSPAPSANSSSTSASSSPSSPTSPTSSNPASGSPGAYL